MVPVSILPAYVSQKQGTVLRSCYPSPLISSVTRKKKCTKMCAWFRADCCNATDCIQNNRGRGRIRSLRRLRIQGWSVHMLANSPQRVILQVIIWKCIWNKRLVQICIEGYRRTLCIVRTRKVSHYMCSKNWVLICNHWLAAGVWHSHLWTGAVPLDSGFLAILYGLSLPLLQVRNEVIRRRLQLQVVSSADVCQLFATE